MASGDAVFAKTLVSLYDSVLGPFMFEPFTRETAGRLAGFSGEVLEIAAGTGILTRELDRTLAAASSILATDLNPPMLARAAERLASPRVTWRQADALALPFESASFDIAVCQFGVMFYPDQVAGHSEAHRVLRPGGRYVLTVWDDLTSNPVADTVHRAAAACFPDDPPQFFARTPWTSRHRQADGKPGRGRLRPDVHRNGRARRRTAHRRPTGPGLLSGHAAAPRDRTAGAAGPRRRDPERGAGAAREVRRRADREHDPGPPDRGRSVTRRGRRPAAGNAADHDLSP